MAFVFIRHQQYGFCFNQRRIDEVTDKAMQLSDLDPITKWRPRKFFPLNNFFVSSRSYPIYLHNVTKEWAFVAYVSDSDHSQTIKYKGTGENALFVVDKVMASEMMKRALIENELMLEGHNRNWCSLSLVIWVWELKTKCHSLTKSWFSDTDAVVYVDGQEKMYIISIVHNIFAGI